MMLDNLHKITRLNISEKSYYISKYILNNNWMFFIIRILSIKIINMDLDI